MKTVFFTLLVLVVLVEIYISVQFSKQKKPLLIKLTAAPLGLFCLFLVAVYLFRFIIPFYVLSLSLLSIFINNFMGLYLDYYNKSHMFDRYLHAFGIFSNALLGYYVLINVTSPGGTKFFQAVFIFSLGFAIGAVFEIIEFITDTTQGMHNQRGLKDTNFDIIFDIIGSLAAAIFAYAIIL